MGKIRKNEKGFSVVEIVLVIAVVGLIVVVGYMVYKNHNKTTNNSTTTASATSTTPAKTTTTTPTPKVDPYSGWKTNCDTATNGCFRYPSDWDNLIRGTDVTALGGNKGETLTLEYNEPTDANGGLGDFLTKSVDPVTVSGSSYQLVGGYYTVSNVPGYYLVDSSLAQQLGLKAGVASKITNNDLYFTFNSKKATFVVHYNTAASSGAATIPTSTANAWFTSADGQTALKAVQSFYKQ
jgi:hypothetical protein